MIVYRSYRFRCLASLTLCLMAAPVQSQPLPTTAPTDTLYLVLAQAPPGLAHHLPPSFGSSVQGDDVDLLYRNITLVIFGSVGGAGTGLVYASAVAPMFILGPLPEEALYVAYTLGSTVGVLTMASLLDDPEAGRRGRAARWSAGMLFGSQIRDWHRTLPGALAGLLPAAAAITIAGRLDNGNPDGEGSAAAVTGMIAIPVFQSIGAAVSLSLSQ